CAEIPFARFSRLSERRVVSREKSVIRTHAQLSRSQCQDSSSINSSRFAPPAVFSRLRCRRTLSHRPDARCGAIGPTIARSTRRPTPANSREGGGGGFSPYPPARAHA